MLAWLCAALLSFAGLAIGQDAPTTRRVTTAGAQVQINQIEISEFPKVVIFATVLKDDVPVPGLTAQDFRVREDEVDQEPLTVVPQLTPLSAVLTLDTSGSMKQRLPDAQAAAKSFLTLLQAQDKLQVIRFSRDVKTLYPLGSDRRAAEVAIDGTVARGDTALWDALYASVESLRGVAGRKAIILLSDGVDDDGSGKPLSKRLVTDVLALARQVNVPIYAIGLGTELDELALKKVAGETGARYLNAVEASELTQLYDSIGKQLAGQYTISYTSNLPVDGSEHHVQLKAGDSTSMKSYLPTATTPVAKPVTEKPIASQPETGIPTQELFLAPGKTNLRARLGAHTPDLVNWSSGKWTILESQADFEGRFKEVAYSYEAQPILTLNEGDYKLQVKLGDASRIVALHVKPGSPAQGTVALGAGQVRLMAQLGPSSAPLQTWSSGKWTILETQADFEGRHKEVGYSYDAQPIVTLNEGDYKLEMKIGDAMRTVDLSVKTGEQKSMEVVLGAGQVKLMARLSAENPPLQTWSSGKWTILEPNVDFEGRQKEVAYSYEAQPIITLLEGDYRLRVKVGDATQETDLTVKAGEQQVVEVNVSAKR
jgi:VWFA-related protein